MDFHIDRKLKYISDTKHKGLHSWAIAEVNEAGEQVGNELIPWNWNLHFTATRITFGESIRLAPKNLRSKTGEVEVTEPRMIRAILKPGYARDDDIYGGTSYFMLGTDRAINAFDLWVTPLEDDSAKEECYSWGSVSYTAEVDFRYQTQEDCLSFYLNVKRQTFERYAALISQRSVSEVILRVGGVDGFYSEWSPGISTSKIRVLTHGKEQEVLLPEGVEEAPPRLGRVGECQLSINSVIELTTDD